MEDARQVIGVRELKARLSRHLRRAQAGERLVVTDRGRAIAALGPVEEPARPAWILQLVAEGRATWNGGKPAGVANRIKTKHLLASAAVIEGRR